MEKLDELAFQVQGGQLPDARSNRMSLIIYATVPQNPHIVVNIASERLKEVET